MGARKCVYGAKNVDCQTITAADEKKMFASRRITSSQAQFVF